MEAMADSSLLLLTGLCIVATAVIFILYRVLVSPHQLLSSHGINGPYPLPLFGNYLSISKVGNEQFLVRQIEKFGPVFGYYVGTAPKVSISDVEVLKDIMVKEFDSFSDRGFLGSPNLIPKALGIQAGMVVSGVEVWRPGRRALTPSFSAMKMKLMEPLFKKSTEVLLEILGEFAESGNSVEVFRVYSAFTLEAMMATAFGQSVAVQRGEGDRLTNAAQTVFSKAVEGSALSTPTLTFILSTFPCLEPLILRAVRTSEAGRAMKLMYDVAGSLIETRMQRQEPLPVKDLLQLMIDATVESEHSSANKLTSEQIAGFSMDFFLAGHETTASTLGFTSYLLAVNTAVQENLQAKIDEYFEENPDGSLYEAAQKLKYLEMVLFEAMRMYTPLPFTQRHCNKTVTVGGVTIPRGADVIIPLNIIHRTHKYWPDPNRFDPDRFRAEEKECRPQLAHMSFGWGPRNCIGLRFALLQAKIALMEILRKYSFVQGPETPLQADLELVQGLTTTPKGGVMIKIIPRT